jgi:hypothetical protein
VHGTALRSVSNKTERIKADDILLFCTLRNEAFRIEWFLEYYRRIGVNHFFFVDNGSTDNFLPLVVNQPDVSVWHTTASYKNSNFGMHWLNALLRRYGRGHWCVTVDPDEFLIYPFCETRNLRELTEWLDSNGRSSMFCLLLDMYSDRPVRETHCAAGKNPLLVAPYFDGGGYTQDFNSRLGNVWVQGGPRRRVFFRRTPSSAPALNKTALVKWRWDYSYISSMHTLTHPRLNRPHSGQELMPTGCLLHFKFLSALKEKAEEEISRKQHYDGSLEYIGYKNIIDTEGDNLLYSGSVKYASSAQLIELGLMQRGMWF